MKSEREKMLAGELYRATEPELVEAARRAHALMAAFNATAGPAGMEILRQLLGKVGEGVTVRPRFSCDYGTNISIGRGTFVNFDCVFLDCATIELGEDVQVAPGVHLYTAGHPIDPELRRSGLEFALPIRIEDNVWLGGGAIVCPGVTIGKNSVIGAGSVVVRDIPPDVIAVGNPCRVVRSALTPPV
ncbi:MAG: sugar O-acetyltransferase [Kofleriaceae bacterium]